MNIPAIDIGDVMGAVNELSSPAALRGDNSQRSFHDVLGIARTRAPAPGPNATPEEVERLTSAREAESREAAEQFVAKTFLEPLLQSMRENSQAAPPFAPTQAEKQFRAFADARLAVDIVQRSNMPIVDRLARDLLA